MNAVRRSRRLWFLKLKEFEKAQPGIHAFVRARFLDAEGRARVMIDLSGAKTLYDPLSHTPQRALDPAILDKIDRVIYNIPVEYPILLCLIADGLSTDVQRDVQALLREHYATVLRDKGLDLRDNGTKIALLAALGVVLLTVSFGIGRHALNPVLAEFLSITATFSLWEAVDFFLLERRQLKTERLNAGQMALAEVQFQQEDRSSP